LSNLENILKALTISSTESVIAQDQIDKELAQLVNYEHPLRMNLPRKPGSGSGYSVIRRSAPGTTLAAWVSDTTNSDTTQDEGTYAKYTYGFKTVLAQGQVTRKLRAEGMNIVDILTDEIEARVGDFREIEERGYLVGSSQTSNQFDSVRYLIPNSQSYNCGTGATPGTLTLKKLDAAIDKAKGMPSALIMSKAARRELNTLMQAVQAVISYTDVIGGFKLPAYNGIPVYVSSVISDDQTWDGMTTADGSGGASTSIYIPKWSELFIAELTPIAIKMLAPTTSQYEKFEIYCDETLIIRDYLQCAKLINISI
jgi:hypothetical protein